MGGTPHRRQGLARLLACCQPHWARAVLNDPVPGPPGELVPGDLELFAACPAQVLAVFPTHLARPQEEPRETLRDFARQLIHASRTLDLPIALVVGMQYQPEGDANLAVERARWLLEDLPQGLAAVTAFTLRSRIKVDTLNAAHTLALQMGAPALTWIDDDVSLDPGGLTALCSTWLDPGFAACDAFGLKRVAIRSQNWLARINAVRRSFARDQKHPFGCSILLRTASDAWPLARWSDDTWLAAALIDPAAADPFHRSHVVMSHAVYYQVPEGFIYAISRIRRIHNHQLMVLSAVTPEQGAIYMTQAMFGGVFARRSRGLKGMAGLLLSLAMQSTSMVLWLLRAGWYLFRGALNWPVQRPPWAVEDRYLRPAAPPDTVV